MGDSVLKLYNVRFFLHNWDYSVCLKTIIPRFLQINVISCESGKTGFEDGQTKCAVEKS